MTNYHIGFILEQTLGHVTHTRNLQMHIARDIDVQAHWGLVPWDVDRTARWMPLYRNWTVRAGVRARGSIADILRKTPVDVLFFHTQVPAILSPDWLRRIPSVISLDATPLQYDALGQFYNHTPGSPLTERLKSHIHRNCFHAARRLVTWSYWAKQGLVNDYGVPEEKVVVIPPGVTTDIWTRPIPRTPHIGPVKILFVGGNLARKGGLLLLEAFRQLRPLGVELHLVTRDKLEAEPGLYVYNTMQPNSDELKQLYHTSDIFCLPTLGDCLPMVLSEAGAAGLPTVSTSVAAIPEIVKDGRTGSLVAPGDGAALTEALRRLVLDSDLRIQQGRRATALVATEFDAKHNAQRLLDVLKQEADAVPTRWKLA